MSGTKTLRAEATPATRRYTDWPLLLLGIVALVTMAVEYYSDRNILPELTSTYTLQPVLFYQRDGLSDAFSSRSVYMASEWNTKHGLHAVGALKYSLGCFGNQAPVLFQGNDPASLYVDLAALQKNWDTAGPVSICTCIDTHASLAIPATVALVRSITTDLQAVVPGSRSAVQSYALERVQSGAMAGNVFSEPTDAEFARIVEFREWCSDTAAPQYAVHFASVYNTKLLVLVGLALMFVSLDVLGVRKRVQTAYHDLMVWVWFIDILPLVFFVWQLLSFQANNKLNTTVPAGQQQEYSFLNVLTCITAALAVILMVLLTFFSRVMCQHEQSLKQYNELFERVFTDVPMIAGLALVGVGLKMQNAEHDETILTTTYVLLVSAGLIQHLCNLIRIVYDIFCGRLDTTVLTQLQSGTGPAEGNEEDLTATKHILQFFGWTRLYGFLVVVVIGVFSYTISSTATTSHNPLAIYTQNQYMYFIIVFVIALTGLDFFYEVLPFVTEHDEEYGVESADRLRKFAVLTYIIFLMLSHYNTGNQEL